MSVQKREGGAVGRLTDLVLDCADPERLAAFWGSLLGVGVADRTDSFVELERLPNGIGLGFQKVPEPKVGKVRLHIDITAPDQDAAVERVIALGGRHVEDIKTWRVMTDPEGHEFCLLREK